MINLNELEGQIKNINLNLKDKYDFVFKLNNEDFRNKINSEVGKIIKLKKFNKNEISKYKRTVGVDGSNNRSGGAFPHFIEIFQGLAKSTDGKEVYKTKVYTPTLNSLFDEQNL